MKIPLCLPFIDEKEKEAVIEVLESGWMAHGPYNKKFEADFANYIGVKHAITMNSCTSALQLAVEANNITGEVILPSFTFVASANAIIKAGATPIFADIDKRTFNICPIEIENKITSKTEAIMPVHFAGQPCDMDKIEHIAKKHNLIIIEDSAETIGGKWSNKQAGSFAIGCFSFFPTKNFTTGEGGMLTTNDDKLAQKVKALVGHGITSSTYDRHEKELSWFRSASYAGYNFRMSNILAALGYHQLKKLDSLNINRRKIAEKYNNAFSEINEITIPYVESNAYHVYQMYVICLKQNINRNEFVKKLNEKDVGASVHFYPPVHLQYYYKDKHKGSLSVTEDICQRCVTLPIYPQMNQEEIDYVINVVKDVIGKLN